MKTIYQNQIIYFFVLKKGEELMETLVDFCKRNKINSGYFTAIGACGETVLSWYDLGGKTYEDHEYKEGLEIVSLTGNIALLKGIPMLHVHGTFSRRDLSVVGGHVKKMTVSATCEVRLETFDESIERNFDHETGLNLLS